MEKEELNYKENVVFGDIFEEDDNYEGEPFAIDDVEERSSKSLAGGEPSKFEDFIRKNIGNCELAMFRIPMSISKISNCSSSDLQNVINKEEEFWRELIEEEGITLRSEEFFFTKLTFLLYSCR